jgi:hypothetical protein
MLRLSIALTGSAEPAMDLHLTWSETSSGHDYPRPTGSIDYLFLPGSCRYLQAHTRRLGCSPRAHPYPTGPLQGYAGIRRFSNSSQAFWWLAMTSTGCLWAWNPKPKKTAERPWGPNQNCGLFMSSFARPDRNHVARREMQPHRLPTVE